MSVKNPFEINEIVRKIQNQIYSIQKENFIMKIIWLSNCINTVGNGSTDELIKEVINSINAVQRQVYSMFYIRLIV